MSTLIGISAPPDKTTIRITEKAIAKINEILKSEGKTGHGLRMAVAGGGCSGLQYNLGFEEKPGPEDKVLHYEGFDVFVDAMSLTYLGGVQVDFVDGLQGTGFKIENPNAHGSCGCGHSFQA